MNSSEKLKKTFWISYFVMLGIAWFGIWNLLLFGGKMLELYCILQFISVMVHWYIYWKCSSSGIKL